MELSRWLTYFKERFPIAVYAILVGGFQASGMALIGMHFEIAPFLYGFLGLLLFFALLRLMDERKDYGKDLLAHPERPLPRGLITVPEAESGILCGVAVMVGYSLLTAVLFNVPASLLYVAMTAHLWLMYREFYSGGWLEERQLVYAVSHQLVLLWLCAFSVVLVSPEAVFHPTTYQYGFLILGSFFSYEVCRKLDPEANAVLRTYRSLYGISGTLTLVAVASGIAAVAAQSLGLAWLLWPCELVVLASFLLLSRPKGHRIVEAIASLSLVIHLWAVAFKEWIL